MWHQMHCDWLHVLEIYFGDGLRERTKDLVEHRTPNIDTRYIGIHATNPQ